MSLNNLVTPPAPHRPWESFAPPLEVLPQQPPAVRPAEPFPWGKVLFGAALAVAGAHAISKIIEQPRAQSRGAARRLARSRTEGLHFEVDGTEALLDEHPTAASIATQVHVPLPDGRARRADAIVGHPNGSERVYEFTAQAVVGPRKVEQLRETVEGRRIAGNRTAGSMVVSEDTIVTQRAQIALARHRLELLRLKR